MNFKSVLKAYSQLRQLTPEEAALLELLRTMTDTDRELLAESLSIGKPKPAVKMKQKRKIEHCVAEGCGLTRRALVHKDEQAKGYHVFTTGASMPLPKKPQRQAQPPRCVACYEIEDHPNHDLDNGGHEFETSVAKSIIKALEHHNAPAEERCTAIRDGGRVCGLLVDNNVHQMRLAQGYHEFESPEAARAAVGD